MRFDVLTLFPEFFESPLKVGVINRAIAKGLLEVQAHNIRDFSLSRHRTVDDAPYGGGQGMVMEAAPVVLALEHVKGLCTDASGDTAVILTTPAGKTFNHALARELSAKNRLILICGRYEGVDERVMEFVDIPVSVGDYVMTGGEIPALAIIDAVGRLQADVLGDEASNEHDSFTDGLLEYPQYTRPEDFRGLRVPEVLLSGNHAQIERWRRQESLRRTYERRAELLSGATLSEQERDYIKSLEKGGKKD